jgi:hypothetical protein
MYSIWSYLQHQAIYVDPHRIPFSASYYNWAYYLLYGWAAKACLHLMHLDIVWLPTIGRLITLGFALAAGGIFALARRDFKAPGSPLPRLTGCALWVIATLGPLVGFWAITMRPDMGALALECAGLYLVLRYVHGGNWLLVAAAALLFYGAWAFKQSQVTMLTGSVLALLLLKRRRAAFALSVIWCAAVAVTLVAGGPLYRESILFSQIHFPFTVSAGLVNLLRAEIKNPFLLLGVALAAVTGWRQIRWRAPQPVHTVLTVVILFSFGFALVTSSKTGANDNYYIPAGWAVMLALALNWEQMQRRWMLTGLTVGSWIMAGSIALAVTGWTYYYDFRYQDVFHRMLAEKLRHLPGPIFSTDIYADLPWMHQDAPYFVVGFGYEYDRYAGVAPQAGGLEGLAQKGYFGTLIIDEDYVPEPEMLQRYKLVDEFKDPHDKDYKVYRRMEPGDQ